MEKHLSTTSMANFSIDGMVGNIRKFIEKKGLIRVNARINAERLNLHNMHITNALGNRTLSFALL